MKKQVLVIHGGDAFLSYDEYLSSLKEREVTLDQFSRKGWKKNLGEVLGDTFDVLTPSMPNSQNAHYVEWKMWFKKIIPLLNDEIILVGHSLGGIFLLKYLAENLFSKKIIRLFVVAAPYATKAHPCGDFDLPHDLSRIGEQVGEIVLYHSKDDQVVPYADSEKYQEKLPIAEMRIFENRGHFNGEDFPELVEDIKRLG